MVEESLRESRETKANHGVKILGAGFLGISRQEEYYRESITRERKCAMHAVLCVEAPKSLVDINPLPL